MINKRRVCVLGDEAGLRILKESLPDLKPDIIVVDQKRPQAGIAANEWAKTAGSRIIEHPQANDHGAYGDFRNAVRRCQPDLGICFSYGRILKPDILDIFSGHIYNIHGSLLPQYRGANALNWTIINGEKETGATLHQMVDKVDAGPIVAQLPVQIEFTDTAVNIQEKLRLAVMRLLQENWQLLLDGNPKLAEQDESQATYVSRRTPDDGLFEWNSSALDIYNLIRALVAPWPGARYRHNGREIVIDRFVSYEEVKAMQKDMIGYVYER